MITQNINKNVNNNLKKKNIKQNNNLYILGLVLVLLLISYFILNKSNSTKSVNNSYIYNDIANMRIPSRG
jgi:ABC-type phosphate/phosphonate transport system permease subunit